MTKEEIRDYLEIKLSSHPDHIMDNCDRLVWISDVVEEVYKMQSKRNLKLKRVLK